MTTHKLKLGARLLTLLAGAMGLTISTQAAPRKNSAASKKAPVANPASQSYRASRTPNVKVRFMPAPTQRAGAASVYVRPGANVPRTLPSPERRPNPPVVRALPGGGGAAKLDKSWQSESRAVRVNGKLHTLCTDAAHGRATHYHDAAGRHNVR